MAITSPAIKSFLRICQNLVDADAATLDDFLSRSEEAIRKASSQVDSNQKVTTDKCDIPFILSDVLTPEQLKRWDSLDTEKKEKLLLSYLRFAAWRRELQTENETDLIIRVRQTKTLKALKKLKKGPMIRLENGKYTMPALAERWQAANERNTDQSPVSRGYVSGSDIFNAKPASDFNEVIGEHEKLLRRKQWSDRAAIGVTAIVGLAVGLIAAVAIMLILPHLSLGFFIPVFLAFALAGSLTEGLVYHRYVKKFLRHLFVRGFFEDIDRKLVKRDTSKRIALLYDKDRAAQEVLNNRKVERYLKRSAILLLSLLAVIAGIGFAGLTFSHVVTLLTMVGVVSGPLVVIFPWAAAVLAGIVFAFVMYEMLHRIIRKDIWRRIKDETIALFTHDDWNNASGVEKAWHIFKCGLKALGLAIVLGIAITATIFTLNEWLSSGILFLQSALHLSASMATQFATAMTAILLGLNAWFCVENSLETVKEFCKLSLQALKETTLDFIRHPSKLFSFLINALAFIVHVVGVGAVAVQGANASGGTNPMKPILAGSLGVTSETLVDLHAIAPESHEEGHCEHGHDHNVAGALSEGCGKIFGKHHNHAHAADDKVPIKITAQPVQPQ